jgi:NADPH:quinone reductase-like Zn-dependent oxidoreductase
MFAVQIAKVLNTEVTAVCGTRTLDLVRTLGADRVIDYTQQDFTQLGDTYDLVFDTVAKASFRRCAPVLKPAGIYVTTLPKLEDILWSLPGKVLPVKQSKIALAQPHASDLDQLKGWIEAGRVRSIIDRTYHLEELVEAHQYSEAGHAVGKVVLSVLQS